MSRFGQQRALRRSTVESKRPGAERSSAMRDCALRSAETGENVHATLSFMKARASKTEPGEGQTLHATEHPFETLPCFIRPLALGAFDPTHAQTSHNPAKVTALRRKLLSSTVKMGGREW